MFIYSIGLRPNETSVKGYRRNEYILNFQRQEKRVIRIRERFEDKVSRIQLVAADLYCRCGDRDTSTAVNNLQLISQLPSFGKRKRRDAGIDS